MNIVAIVLARYSSSRLRGKVLFQLGGETILGICCRKMASVPGVQVVVATSDDPSDDPIEAWAREQGVAVHRGSLNNVADRVASCLQKYPCDAFFRINADSPFLQIDLIKSSLDAFHAAPDTDLITNVQERTYPYGIAVELIRTASYFSSLRKFAGSENEHITSFFYRNASSFNILNLRHESDLSQHRFVLDTPEDWEHIQALYAQNPSLFSLNLIQLIKFQE
jgi:spore coat polysaccharide biosynthesis protein SpsF